MTCADDRRPIFHRACSLRVRYIIYAARNKYNAVYECCTWLYTSCFVIIIAVIIILQYVRTDRPARSTEAATAVQQCTIATTVLSEYKTPTNHEI